MDAHEHHNDEPDGMTGRPVRSFAPPIPSDIYPAGDEDEAEAEYRAFHTEPEPTRPYCPDCLAHTTPDLHSPTNCGTCLWRYERVEGPKRTPVAAGRRVTT